MKDQREKDQREKARTPILAAGGVVMRSGTEPLVAVVQLRKCNSWVLPKGKLNADESALAAARREVLEEVGYKVHIHEFLGAISYDVSDRVKVVQFWRMRAIGEPARRRLTSDVKAVLWLPLDEAIEKLSRSREQAFLQSVAPVVAKAFARTSRKGRPAEQLAPKSLLEGGERSGGKEVLALTEPASLAGDTPASLPSPRDQIVETVRAWFGRSRRRHAA